MDIRIINLLDAFVNNGCDNKGIADMSNDWWHTDIYLLISRWSPVGIKLYITLLTDPMFDEMIVWAVDISLALPSKENLNSIGQITLKDIHRTRLDEFVKKNQCYCFEKQSGRLITVYLLTY